MSQPLNFDTPDRPVWPIILALLVVWLGFICTAEAQTSEEPKQTEEITETSKCGAPLQIFKGLQLVSLTIQPDSLQAVAIYYRKLTDGKILLFRLIRQNCEAGWQEAGVKVFPAPTCVETDSTKCL